MLSGEELKFCIEEIEEDLETGTLGAQPYFDRIKEYIVELQELLLSREEKNMRQKEGGRGELPKIKES
jgi:hypothetical protein